MPGLLDNLNWQVLDLVRVAFSSSGMRGSKGLEFLKEWVGDGASFLVQIFKNFKLFKTKGLNSKYPMLFDS